MDTDISNRLLEIYVFWIVIELEAFPDLFSKAVCISAATVTASCAFIDVLKFSSTFTLSYTNQKLKGAVSRYSVIFCAFLREQKYAIARVGVADFRSDVDTVTAWSAARTACHLRWLHSATVQWTYDKSIKRRTASLADVDREQFCFQATRPK